MNDQAGLEDVWVSILSHWVLLKDLSTLDIACGGRARNSWHLKLIRRLNPDFISTSIRVSNQRALFQWIHGRGSKPNKALIEFSVIPDIARDKLSFPQVSYLIVAKESRSQAKLVDIDIQGLVSTFPSIDALELASSSCLSWISFDRKFSPMSSATQVDGCKVLRETDEFLASQCLINLVSQFRGSIQDLQLYSLHSLEQIRLLPDLPQLRSLSISLIHLPLLEALECCRWLSQITSLTIQSNRLTVDESSTLVSKLSTILPNNIRAIEVAKAQISFPSFQSLWLRWQATVRTLSFKSISCTVDRNQRSAKVTFDPACISCEAILGFIIEQLAPHITVLSLTVEDCSLELDSISFVRMGSSLGGLLTKLDYRELTLQGLCDLFGSCPHLTKVDSDVVSLQRSDDCCSSNNWLIVQCDDSVDNSIMVLQHLLETFKGILRPSHIKLSILSGRCRDVETFVWSLDRPSSSLRHIVIQLIAEGLILPFGALVALASSCASLDELCVTVSMMDITAFEYHRVDASFLKPTVSRQRELTLHVDYCPLEHFHLLSMLSDRVVALKLVAHPRKDDPSRALEIIRRAQDELPALRSLSIPRSGYSVDTLASFLKMCPMLDAFYGCDVRFERRTESPVSLCQLQLHAMPCNWTGLLAALPSPLQELAIDAPHGLSDADIVALGSFPQLLGLSTTSLILYLGTTVTDQSLRTLIKPMVNIRFLHLSCNPRNAVHDRHLMAISDCCPALSEFQLEGTDIISEDGLSAFLRNHALLLQRRSSVTLIDCDVPLSQGFLNTITTLRCRQFARLTNCGAAV